MSRFKIYIASKTDCITHSVAMPSLFRVWLIVVTS